MANQSTFQEVLHILMRPENQAWATLILIYFVVMTVLLLRGSYSIRKDLRDALQKIKRSGIYSRSEGSKERSYSILNSILEENKTLQHSWHEFKEGLVCEVENFEMNGEKKTVRVYKNAIESEQFFNFDCVVINSERWLFGVKFGMFDSAPNILTGLGIFGTFVGIVIGLPATLEGDMAIHMEEFIRGMRVAFGTSILGLSCSLLFTVVDKWIHDHLEQSINKLASDIDFLFIRKSEQEYLHKIAQELKLNHEAIVSMSEGIGQKVAQGFQSLGVDSIQINESIKKGIQDGMQRLSDNLNEMLIKQEKLHVAADLMIEVTSSLRSSLELANDGIKNQTNNVVSSAEGVSRLTQAMGEINEHLVPQIQSHVALSKDLIGAADQTNQVVGRLVSEREALVGQFNTLQSTIQESVKGLGTAFDLYQSKSTSTIQVSLKEFDNELSKGVNHLSSVLIDMGSLGQEIMKIHEDIRKQIKGPERVN